MQHVKGPWRCCGITGETTLEIEQVRIEALVRVEGGWFLRFRARKEPFWTAVDCLKHRIGEDKRRWESGPARWTSKRGSGPSTMKQKPGDGRSNARSDGMKHCTGLGARALG